MVLRWVLNFKHTLRSVPLVAGKRYRVIEDNPDDTSLVVKEAFTMPNVPGLVSADFYIRFQGQVTIDPARLTNAQKAAISDLPEIDRIDIVDIPA